MPQPETKVSQHNTFLSPVEERHIDYILEEEFSVNPDFLEFFIKEARRKATDPNRIMQCADYGNCVAVRSATTEDGETDVLVTYDKQDHRLPIAILIEDKIRAGFQPEQAKRYRKRGEEGKGKDWYDYWSCLVSHTEYTVEANDFDASVSLQALHGYFAEKTDPRSQFRARMLKQVICKYENTGIQNIDAGMTRIRAMYAAECAEYFKPGKWLYEKARDAWWDDNWFLFRHIDWPLGVQVRHQSRTGHMDLILPTRDEPLLHILIEQCAAWHPDFPAPRIAILPVGKSKSAFQINVPKITDFRTDAPTPPFEDFFSAIQFFVNFYTRCSDLLPEALRLKTAQEYVLSAGHSETTALRPMLLGYMRSTVMGLGAEMPYPLPDLQRLTLDTPAGERSFPILGLMGAFHLELRHDERQGAYIIAEVTSRQWGAYSQRHKITASEILRLEDEA